MAHQEREVNFESISMERFHYFIEFILDPGLDVNYLDKKGKTMLSHAAAAGRLEIAEVLVEKGADCNIANSDGSKPLHIAAQCGRKEIVKYFLDKGISANSCDTNNCTPLHYTARYDISPRECYQEIIHLLVDNGADLEAVDWAFHTPLVNAAFMSRKHIVELLIKLGANVNYCNDTRWTVLHHSCRLGWLGIVRILVEGEFDIDLNLRTSANRTPLSIAATWSYKGIVELLIKSGAVLDYDKKIPYTLLHHACRCGWSDLVKYFVNTGFDINAKCENGTPLDLAAGNSRRSVITYLIESGANPADCVRDGRTVLHLASKRGWLEVIKAFIKKGWDLNVPNTRHDTPLHIAVHARHIEIVGYLLKAGADWNLPDFYVITAFGICVRNRVLEGIMLFIENGAYIQSCDYNIIVNVPLLKESILQNVKLCTQVVLNQFNNVELPKVYEILVFARMLPSVERLKIASQGNVAKDIAKSINYEIETKGYCDLLNVRPIILKCLCIRSLLEYDNN